MPFLISHFDKCTGCLICALACSGKHQGGYNPRLARLAVRMSDNGLVHFPTVCNQCENAFCERSCPMEAIGRDNALGIPTVDREKCIGCGSCARACPLGVIAIVNKKSNKCDLCGGKPECVAQCPTGALEYLGKAGG